MKEDRFARDMARLEAVRHRTQQRLDQQQQRVEQRLGRMQERLERKFCKTTDAQQRIIQAALELLKDEGLASLTQRKLAAKLEMQAPALYWHFKNKEVLVDFLAEAILGQEFTSLEPKADDQAWQDWLSNHMVRLRRAMLRYPDGARVVAGAHLYPAITLARSLECGLASLTSGGLSLREAQAVMTTATTYTFGYVIEEQAAPTPEQIAAVDLDAFLEPFPYMARAVRLEDYSRDGQDKDFLQGLGYIIRGAST